MPTSVPDPSRRPRRARLLVAVAVTAVLGLLALPAVSSANVDKRHADEYGKAVDDLARKYRELARNTNKLGTVLTSHFARMQELMGSTDPADQAELQDLQRRCGETRLLTMTTMIRTGEDLTSTAGRLYRAAVRGGWFGDLGDRIDFKEAVQDFIAGSERYTRGLEGFQDAWGELAGLSFRPAVDERHRAFTLMRKGGERCVKAVGALRALE